MNGALPMKVLHRPQKATNAVGAQDVGSEPSISDIRAKYGSYAAYWQKMLDRDQKSSEATTTRGHLLVRSRLIHES
jgi:hypothetical protein